VAAGLSALRPDDGIVLVHDAARCLAPADLFYLLERAYASGASATDDAGLVEQMGGQVSVVRGDPLALKITSPLDLAVAAVLLQDVLHVG